MILYLLDSIGIPKIILSMYIYIYTIWEFNIAMENGPFIDDFPIKTLKLPFIRVFPWLC